MPNRRTHKKITIIATIFLAPVHLYVSRDISTSLAITFGMLITVHFKAFGVSVYLNPDMDIKANAGNLAQALGIDAYQKSISHRAGLNKKDWVGFWRNPAKIFTFSHIPLFGTLPRAALVSLLLGIVSYIIHLEVIYLLVFVSVGMVISDTLHVASDITWSFVKARKAGKVGKWKQSS